MLKYLIFFTAKCISKKKMIETQIFCLVWNQMNWGFVGAWCVWWRRDHGHRERDIVVFKSAGFEGSGGANAHTAVIGVALISVTGGTRDLWPLPLMRSPLTVQ